jgi:hypothetical protein
LAGDDTVRIFHDDDMGRITNGGTGLAGGGDFIVHFGGVFSRLSDGDVWHDQCIGCLSEDGCSIAAPLHDPEIIVTARK